MCNLFIFSGGALFGILGEKTVKWGRDPIVMVGFLIHVLSYFLIFLNLPDSAPFTDTDAVGFINANAIVAMTCSFLLGLGDACFNTQIYSMLGGVFSKDSAAAFAIFKFTQVPFCCICIEIWYVGCVERLRKPGY